MQKYFIAGFLLAGLAGSVGANATTGTTAAHPGFSAKDILIQSGYTAPSGIYWIDPDLPGDNGAFQIFADMTSQGGGWTLAHDRANSMPDLDNMPNALGIDVLSVSQNAQIRFVGNGTDAFYAGRYYETLPVTGWTIISGNASSLINRPWTSINFTEYDVYVRESLTTAYPVPEPDSYAMFLAGLGIVGAAARRCAKE